ncbi:MAG: RTX toxin, partial [Actinobacteria bacterium]|nr:RTX toxin [Actinomycetota bacterium]NIU64982.1 RTX toxin [Actinomycetota bacterium]NIW26788.1 RTX toxin [Actinomycetota bacterium]
MTTGSDDVEEQPDGYLYVGSSDMELGTDSELQTVGLRFASIDLPADAVVSEAWLEFTVDEVSPGPASYTIKGVPGAPAWSGFFGVTGLSTTAESVSWAPPEWNSIGVSGPDQRSPDLAPIVRELVAGGAAPGALSFVIAGSGRRTAESFEGGVPPR